MLDSMSVHQLFVLVIFLMVNCVIVSILPIMIYWLVKSQPFREFISSFLQDGDGIGHKQDAKDAVVLFFAFMFAWGDLDLIFVVAYFNKLTTETFVFLGMVTAIMFSFFGIAWKK